MKFAKFQGVKKERRVNAFQNVFAEALGQGDKSQPSRITRDRGWLSRASPLPTAVCDAVCDRKNIKILLVAQ